ncbi:MAG: hypothetical protein WCF90_09905 [Methanomicrobiales archaeon]
MIHGTPVAGVNLSAKQFWQAGWGVESTSLIDEGDIETGMIDALDLHPEIYVPPDGGQQDCCGLALVHHYHVRDQRGSKILKKGLRGDEEPRSEYALYRVHRYSHADIVIKSKTDIHQSDD